MQSVRRAWISTFGEPFPDAHLETEYQLAKTEGLDSVLTWIAAVATFLNVVFVVLDKEDLEMSETLWPAVFVLRISSVGMLIMGLGAAAVALRILPVHLQRRLRLNMDLVLLASGLFMSTSFAVDTHRVLAMLGSSCARSPNCPAARRRLTARPPSTMCARKVFHHAFHHAARFANVDSHEIEKWIRLHDPPKLRQLPTCPGYVDGSKWLDGDAGRGRCFVNGHEGAFLIIIITYAVRSCACADAAHPCPSQMHTPIVDAHPPIAGGARAQLPDGASSLLAAHAVH